MYSSLSIKVSSYKYRNFHYKDKTVWRPSYLYNENFHTGKDGTCTVFILKRYRIKRDLCFERPLHYSDVIMSAMASQITSLTIVYSTVYSGADQRKHQSSASLAFVRGIHRWPVNSPHKGPVTWKMFPFDDVIMQCRMAFMAASASFNLAVSKMAEAITGRTGRCFAWYFKPGLTNSKNFSKLKSYKSSRFVISCRYRLVRKETALCVQNLTMIPLIHLRNAQF